MAFSSLNVDNFREGTIRFFLPSPSQLKMSICTWNKCSQCVKGVDMTVDMCTSCNFAHDCCNVCSNLDVQHLQLSRDTRSLPFIYQVFLFVHKQHLWTLIIKPLVIFKPLNIIYLMHLYSTFPPHCRCSRWQACMLASMNKQTAFT